MSSKTMLRKCVAVASAGLIAAGMLGVSSLLVGAAPPENLLSGFTLSSSDTEKYQVDSATNSITVNDAAEHTVYFSGVTLDKDTTYTYEFTFRAASVSNSPQFRFPIRAEGFQSGQWLSLWPGMNQVRLSTDYWSNNDASAGSFTFAAETDYRFKIVSEPQKASIYIDDVLVHEAAFASLYTNGQVGFGGYTLPAYTLSGVSLSKQSAEPPVENLLDAFTLSEQDDTKYQADTANHAVSVNNADEHTVYFNGVALDKDATYTYEFTFRTTSVSNAPQFRFPIRAQDPQNGQWLSLWPELNQVRLSTDYWSNNNASAGSFTFAAETDYRFKIVSEPQKVSIYINDALVHEAAFASAYTDGKLGFGGYNLPAYTLKNLSLTKQGGDEPAGDNLLKGFSLTWDAHDKYSIDAATNSITVKEGDDHAITFADVALEKNGIYTYSFTFNMKGDSVQLRMPIRTTNPNDTAAGGQWMADWFSLNQLRLSEHYSGDPFLGIGTKELKPNQDYRFKIVTEPTKLTVYIDGEKIAETGNDFPLVENGSIGFGGYGMAEYTLKNLSLIKTGTAEGLVDEAAVQNAMTLIDAIGTVTEESGPAIEAARKAYDALNSDEKALVTNYETLTAAETAFTQLSASIDYRYYAVKASELMGTNYWTNSVSATPLSGGGIHFGFKDSGTNMRQGINRPLKLDGLHLEMSNLQVTAGGQIAFFLADYDAQEGYSQLLYNQGARYVPMAIILNTQTGAIEYVTVAFDSPEATEGTPTVHTLASSDSLKAANLAGKTISMRMAAKNGGYTVSIAGVTGTITAEMLTCLNKLSDFNNAYLTICAFGDAVHTLSFDLLSLHGGKETCADDLSKEEADQVDEVMALISAIGTVTSESGEAIQAAEDAFDALSHVQQGLVGNKDVLTAARVVYDRLTSDGVYKDPNYYSITTDDLMGTNHWSNNLSYENVTGGGVRFTWFKAGTDYRVGVNRPMKLDGLHLVFDKLSITSTNKSFAIYLADLFTHGWAEQYSQLAEGPLAIVVDTARGQVRVVTDADRNGTLLMESDSLKYETLSKIPFDFKITAKGDGSYTLRILDTEGTITPAMLEAAPKLTKLNEVYLTVCPYDSSGATSMSYNLLALHGGDVVCADEMTDAMQASIDGVIAAIKRVYNEKGQIVPASGALLDAAWDAYNALDDQLKALVPNLKDLEAADTVYVVVSAIENLGEITLDSADEIASVRGDYKLLGAVNRPLVGNYDTLNAAIMKLYQLQKAANIDKILHGGDSSGDGSGGNANSSPDTGERSALPAAGALAILTGTVVLSVCLLGKRTRRDH